LYHPPAGGELSIFYRNPAIFRRKRKKYRFHLEVEIATWSTEWFRLVAISETDARRSVASSELSLRKLF
jgi:hypothetical protein